MRPSSASPSAGGAWQLSHTEQHAWGRAVFWSWRHRWSSQYQVFSVLAFAMVVMAVAGSRAAESDVRIADPSLKGCTVKGVVQAKVTAPQFPTLGFLTGDAPR